MASNRVVCTFSLHPRTKRTIEMMSEEEQVAMSYIVDRAVELYRKTMAKEDKE